MGQLDHVTEEYARQAAEPEGVARGALNPQGNLAHVAEEYARTQAPPEGEMRHVVDTYERDMSYADEFQAGLGQGTDMLQASMYAMTRSLGRELGIDLLEEFGTEGMEANIEQMQWFQPSVAGFTDIESMDDFFRWSAAALGQAAPSLGTAMAGGGIGGVLAKKAVERSIARVVRDRMLRQLTRKGIVGEVAEEAVEKALRSPAGLDMLKNGFQGRNAMLVEGGFTRGATLGAFAPSAGMQAGETEMTLSEAGYEGGLGAVFGAGFVGGTLEALPALRLIDKMFPGVDKRVAGSFITDFAKATGTQAVLEGSTEGAQEMIQLASLAYHDPTFNMLDPENLDQVINSFAAGALVGAVTGGGAAGIGRFTAQEEDEFNLPRARPVLPDSDRFQRIAGVTLPKITYPEGFEPADNTVFEEVSTQVQSILDEHLTPALNTIGTQYNEGVDRVRAALLRSGVRSEGETYAGRVLAAQDEFIAGHQPIIDDAVRYARESAMWIAEEAANIPSEQMRQQFVLGQLAELREEVGNVATELGVRGDKIAGSIAGSIEGDPVITGPSKGERGAETSFIFGQMHMEKHEFSGPTRYRTRGWSAIPYKTKQQARRNIESVKRQYPSAPDEAFEIRPAERGEGYVIAINDSGIRNVLREDEAVSSVLEAARLSTRGNPDDKRHVHVKLPHRKQKVLLDIPTMVFQGKRLGEGDVQTVEDAFYTIAARLFERNMLDDASFEVLEAGFKRNFKEHERTYTLNQAQRIRESDEYQAARDKDMGDTVDADLPGMGEPGITGDTNLQRSYRAGVRGSSRVTPRAAGQQAGDPRMQSTGQLDPYTQREGAPQNLAPEMDVEVRPRGRTIMEDTEPDSGDTFARLVEDENALGKLPSEKQQAQQSLLDTGGAQTRTDRRGARKRDGVLAKNIESLKQALAKFPAPSKRTKAEQAEHKAIAEGLAILERVPKTKAENAKVKRALDKAGRYTTSGTTGKKRLPQNRGDRSKIAKSDPEGKKVSVLKPKPLKYKWVAVEGEAHGGSSDVKAAQANMIRGITNKGFHVDVQSVAGVQMKKELAWLVKKVANLMPGVRVAVLDDIALRKIANGPNKDSAWAAQELLKYDSAAMVWLDDMQTAIIKVHNPENQANAIVGVIHELGHALQYSTWREIGLDNQKKLWQAFVDDVKAGKRGSGKVTPATAQGKPLAYDPADINVYEFKEWMADQFVIWMANRRKPRTAIQKFFETLATKLEEFFKVLVNNPGRYGAPLNEDFAEFVDAVANRVAKSGDPATDRYFKFDKLGLSIRALDGDANRLDLDFKATEREYNEAKSNLELLKSAKKKTNEVKIKKQEIKGSPFKGMELERWREALPRELSYREVVRSSKAMQQLMLNLYNVTMAPSTSVMRSLSKQGITAADKLVAVFNRVPHGAKKQAPNYHQQVKRVSHGFINRYNTITNGMTSEQKSALVDDLLNLRAGREGGRAANTLRGRQLRQLLDEMHAYLVAAGLPVGKIENYIPKVFDKALLLENEEAIIQHLTDRYIKEQAFDAQNLPDVRQEAKEKAKKLFSQLATREAEEAGAQEQMAADELAMQSPAFRAMRSAKSKDEYMEQFLNRELDSLIANYINSSVKRAEYNRAFGAPAPEGVTGGDSLPRAMWNPQEKLDKIFAQAKRQGATDEQLMRMKNYVDANLGMYGRDDIGDTTRKVMAGLVAYNNMRVLLFTVFASLPDMMGPVVRSNSMKVPFTEFAKNMGGILKNSSDSEIQQMAEYLGIITDNMSQHVLTEYVDNHYMPPTLRKWNDRFFKYTGLNWYTDMTRKYALAVGVQSIKNAARDAEMGATKRDRGKATRFLRELGLTPANVRGWVRRGSPIYHSPTYTQHGRFAKTDDAIAQALVQFVDESIMSPNPSQRPVMASHPGAMLVYHLKGFMYAMYDVFLKRMKYNWDDAKTVPEAVFVAVPALGMLALTAAGLELRDLVTGNDTKGRMDGWDYTWELFERSGLLGPAQLGWDFEGAGDRGQSELIALGGPALSQVGDLISRPVSQTIPKAIPVVSQLPWMRDALRESTPL